MFYFFSLKNIIHINATHWKFAKKYINTVFLHKNIYLPVLNENLTFLVLNLKLPKTLLKPHNNFYTILAHEFFIIICFILAFLRLGRVYDEQNNMRDNRFQRFRNFFKQIY